jgi:hypothetical protein
MAHEIQARPAGRTGKVAQWRRVPTSAAHVGRSSTAVGANIVARGAMTLVVVIGRLTLALGRAALAPVGERAASQFGKRRSRISPP